MLKNTESRFVDNQGRTDCASTKLDLLATLAVARIAQSETRGQNWIQRLFRGETKPSKHRFEPSGQKIYTFVQITIREEFQVQNVTYSLKFILKRQSRTYVDTAHPIFQLILFVVIVRETETFELIIVN